MKVRLKVPLWDHEKMMPAGTVCDVIQYYPSTHTYALAKGKWRSWAFVKEVIPLFIYGGEYEPDRQ